MEKQPDYQKQFDRAKKRNLLTQQKLKTPSNPLPKRQKNKNMEIIEEESDIPIKLQKGYEQKEKK